MMNEKVKVAVLVANGFKLNDLIQVQKVMTEMMVGMHIISVNQGLVNAWDEQAQGWGHNYPVDTHLNSALGVDYDALVIPGGTRSIEKLKMTAHTRRFINSVMSANKPVAVMGDALEIMDFVEVVAGRNIADVTEDSRIDGNLLTGRVDDAFLEQVKKLLAQNNMEQAA